MHLLIILAATYLYLLVALIAGVTWLFSTSSARTNILKLSFLSFPISFILAQIAGLIYYDPRPFVVEHVQPLIAHAVDNGFPSDHMLLAMTVAAVMFVYHRKVGALLCFMGAIVGIARVVAKVHHPIDIWGSTIIAFVAIVVSWYILKRARTLNDFLTRIFAHLTSRLPHSQSR